MTIIGLIRSETQFISADGTTSFKVAGNEVRFGGLAELQPGETVEFQIKV